MTNNKNSYKRKKNKCLFLIQPLLTLVGSDGLQRLALARLAAQRLAADEFVQGKVYLTAKIEKANNRNKCRQNQI